MHRKELNERSPYRVLESSIHNGLGKGNIGVVVARHGVGKTAFLVGIALDDLMRGRKVLHVSLGQSLGRVREYYDEIFHDLARTARLEDATAIYREVERSRNIHAYLGNTFTLAKLVDDLELLREHVHFEPAAIILDGYDFDRAADADLRELRAIAGRYGCELWMSAVTHRESARDAQGVPEPVARVKDKVDVILQLGHDGKNVHVALLKDHDSPSVPDAHLALDPVTMLLVKEQYVDLDPSYSR